MKIISETTGGGKVEKSATVASKWFDVFVKAIIMYVYGVCVYVCSTTESNYSLAIWWLIPFTSHTLTEIVRTITKSEKSFTS